MKNFLTPFKCLCCCCLLSSITGTLWANTPENLTANPTGTEEVLCTASAGTFVIGGDFFTCLYMPIYVEVAGNETAPDYNTLYLLADGGGNIICANPQQLIHRLLHTALKLLEQLFYCFHWEKHFLTIRKQYKPESMIKFNCIFINWVNNYRHRTYYLRYFITSLQGIDQQ